MPLLTALAISIGVLGAIATYLFLGPLASTGIQLWVIFVAWACFYHVGGKEQGIITTVVHMIFGAVCAWIAFLLITKVGVPTFGAGALAIEAAVAVGLTIVLLVMAANAKPLSVIPASVYGYATTAAYGAFIPILSADGKTVAEGNHLGHLLEASMLNPLIVIAVSAIVGAIFAYVSEKIGGMLHAGAASPKAA